MCVAYLPDRQTAVTGSRDHTVKIWNLKTGRVIRTLEAHTGFVFAVSVSPDGKHIASAGGDRAVRVWEVASGKLVALLEGHTASVIGLKFLSNVELLSAGEDGLRIWNVDNEQLVWKGGVGVSEFDASADGSRAVVTIYANGVHQVWDTGKRTPIRTLGDAGRMRPGLAISPNGTEVYGHDNAQYGSLFRWSVDTGEKLPFTDPHTSIERLAMSPDGSLLLMGSVYGNVDNVMIWDTKSWKLLRYLEAPRDPSQQLLAYTFSPDGKTLLATSGVYLPNQEGAHRQRNDQLRIYDLSDLRNPREGPKAGKLSWQEVPLKVRTLTGDTMIPEEFKGAKGYRTPPWHRFPGGKGRDIILTETSVFFQRTQGQLDQVIFDPAAHFKDLVWDGRYAWLNSQADSCIRVIDGDAHVVSRIGLVQGLPKSNCSLVLYPLAEGRVLAAGTEMKKDGSATQGSGWCGIIQLGAGGKPEIDVFYKEPLAPDNWTHRKENASRAFSPLWMTSGPPQSANPKGGKVHRCIWITCLGTQRDGLPVLRVDPEARSVDLFNFGPPWPNQGMHRSEIFSSAIYWLSKDEMMYQYGPVYRVKPQPTFVDYQDRKLVIDARSDHQTEMAHFLLVGGQLYAPGERWARIDPRTLEVEDIGPGLRVQGELIKSDDVDYFDSAVLGPIAIVKETGQVFQLSVDPKHPLAVAATLEPPGKPVPADGVVEFRDGLTLVYCGDGALSFADGLLKPSRTILYPYQSSRAALDAELAHTLRTVERLQKNPSEKERLNLSADQWKRFQNHRDVPVVVDANSLQELFAVWDHAPDDAARAAAAKPLLAQAKAIGDRDTRMERDYIDRFKAIFTAGQWKLLNYELPDK
jgi:WD40 repeat protein